MDITIDLKTCKIIIHFSKRNSHAVIIPKLGEPIRITIPELIEVLEKVSGGDKKV